MTAMTVDDWYDLLTRMGVRPSTADEWCDVFARVIASYRWSDGADVPNFVAQVVHETGHLENLVENLNYSAARLMQVWPKRFPTMAAARPYERNPRALANKVYGGRLGNHAPDDGWNFRGRGMIQVTGRDNYALVHQLTGMPVLSNPEMLEQPEPAMLASIAWWEENVPDEILGDVQRVTRTVNGGLNGLKERERLTSIARETLGGITQ